MFIRRMQALLLLGSIGLCTTAAKAEPVVVTLTQPTQVVAPQGTITLSGFFTNPGQEAFTITGAAVGGDNFVATQVFSSFQFFNVPQTVAPGVMTPTVLLYTAVLSPILGVNPPSVFFGEYSIVGSNPGGPIEFYRVPFSFTISPTAAVPEPATSLLFGTGLAAIGAVAARRRRKKTGENL